jgi:hypothetical protein
VRAVSLSERLCDVATSATITGRAAGAGLADRGRSTTGVRRGALGHRIPPTGCKNLPRERRLAGAEYAQHVADLGMDRYQTAFV